MRVTDEMIEAIRADLQKTMDGIREAKAEKNRTFEDFYQERLRNDRDFVERLFDLEVKASYWEVVVVPKVHGLTVGGYTARETSYHVYHDGKLCHRSAVGIQIDATRPTRNAGKYKIFVDSHRDAGLPYSIYHIADTKTGKVYDLEITHGMSYRPLDAVVEALKEATA